MPRLFRLAAVCAWLTSIGACEPEARGAAAVTPPGEPDPDAARLVALGGQARRLAERETGWVVLRQVSGGLDTTVFHFTDSAASSVTEVVAPGQEAPPGRWVVRTGLMTPLVGSSEPGIELGSLVVGPRRVAQLITAHWPGCTLRGISLHRAGDTHIWVAFCDTRAGVVTASVDAQTGAFTPSTAPPSIPPRVAQPKP